MNETKTKKVDKQRQLMIDYKHVFGSEVGERVLRDMMRNHFMTRPSHVRSDPYETSYNEGQRAVMLRLMTYMNYDIKKFDELVKQGERDHGIYAND